MRAKVSDFCLVKNAPDGKYSVETRLAGTFGYLAPEYAGFGGIGERLSPGLNFSVKGIKKLCAFAVVLDGKSEELLIRARESFVDRKWCNGTVGRGTISGGDREWWTDRDAEAIHG
ncbi:hypothetical protein GIB67_034105 [Kingdonia uniflora]|uniref:Uncharacterized protein n=1 Tax=Kingdonia uniflora TaxID=39325 RepID=A0A7J7M6A7_9MAGN|nr:hypothetical protein GIB67_034105 [Kingdonia uniflora]